MNLWIPSDDPPLPVWQDDKGEPIESNQLSRTMSQEDFDGALAFVEQLDREMEALRRKMAEVRCTICLQHVKMEGQTIYVCPHMYGALKRAAKQVDVISAVNPLRGIRIEMYVEYPSQNTEHQFIPVSKVPPLSL